MTANEPRVVLTSAGVVSSVGVGAEDFDEAIYAGRSSMGPSEIAPDAGVAAELKEFDPARWLGKKGLRALDRSARMLSVAAQLALAESGIGDDRQAIEPGIACGTMFGSVNSIASFDWSGLEDGPKYVNPMHFPNTVINAPAGQAAIRHRLRGVNSTCCAGLASGLYALQFAADAIRFGRASAMLAGGVDEVCAESLFGFRQAGIASASGRVRPAADDRDGTVPGEGAALAMVEPEDSARSRGAEAQAEICGFGAAHDARAIDAFDRRGEGAAAAIRQALELSGIAPEQVACIVLSSNGSRTGDEMEIAALREVFGPRLDEIPLTAPKATLGETMGAGGAFAALIGAAALAKSRLPPTAGADPCNSLRLWPAPQSISGEYALINAFGCDGANASLVLRKTP